MSPSVINCTSSKLTAVGIMSGKSGKNIIPKRRTLLQYITKSFRVLSRMLETFGLREVIVIDPNLERLVRRR